MNRIVRYNQPKSLFQLFFDDQLTKDSFLKNKNNSIDFPSSNISEDDKSFFIDMAAPGLKKNDFEILIEKDLLIVRANIESKEKKIEKFVRRQEFNYNNFERSFTLPKFVDLEKISADYVDGLLNITIPKNKKSKVDPVKQIKVG